MFVKNNILCKNNFVFVRNSDSEDIHEIITDKIVYINMRIELLFSILLQLHVFCHDVDFAIINFQINYLKFFVSFEKVFFNI